MDMIVIINQMIQLFLILAIGYVLYKIKMFDDTLNKKLTMLLLGVTTPAMILSSVNYASNDSQVSVPFIFLVATLMYLCLMILAFIFMKLFSVKENQQGLYVFMTTFPNVGFMGFPVITAIFGEEGIFYAAIFNMVFNVLIHSLGIILMTYKSDIKVKLHFKTLLSPGIIASVIALLIYFFNIPMPMVLENTFEMLGSITSPIAMLLIGSTLATMKVKDVFREKSIYPFTLLRQIILPILIFPILNYFIQDQLLLGVTFILLSMPVANSAVLFATRYQSGEQLAAKCVFITTLLSVLTIPLLVYFYLL